MKKLIYRNPYLIFYFISCCFDVSHSLVSFKCLSDQSSALLQLKQEFELIKSYNSVDSQQKRDVMATWNDRTDCCLWSGVSCNMSTGHVLSLDLSNNGLQGPLRANSSLFSLDQVQQLNMAFNNFSSSQIPSSFRQLSRLTHLNLSNSVFSGNIPSEFSFLINLVSLDLSENYLYLKKQLDMENLIQNMKSLKDLNLNGVNFYSPVPESLINLSSLVSLSLRGCSLVGEFPNDIFLFPNIQVIDVSNNDDLIVVLPQFQSGSSLRLLDSSFTKLSGEVPESIGYLKSLNILNLRQCGFTGKLPDTMGQLKSLNVLDLNSCSLSGTVPSWVGNLSQLTYLDIANNNFKGHLPVVLRNLSKLTYLDLSHNKFIGQLPLSFGKDLAELTFLDLGFNLFRGPIPSSFGSMSQLLHLHLSDNRFDGMFPILLANLTQLLSLDLSGNQFSDSIPPHIFENFNSINKLDLSNNMFGGAIPLSMFTMPSLVYLNLNDNQFTGPLKIENVSSSRLEYFSLNRNKLNGKIPSSISKLTNLRSLFLGSNNLTGNCEFDMFSKLSVLDLSNNNLNGTHPQCFGNLLSQLDIRHNNFHGSISAICTDVCNLKVLKIGSNQLEGKFPQSLTKCRDLRILDLGHNQIVDTFPFSLQAFPRLAVLILRSNKFYGSIWNPCTYWGFGDLRVFDISSNNFSGKIPSEYFRNWSTVNEEPVRNFHYQSAKDGYYQYSLSDYNDMNKLKILSIMKTIDLSNNHFQGEIPDSIGEIPSLVVLNLSTNGFTKRIPVSLGRLEELEAIDLSRNMLSGEIPEQLANLKSLSLLNLSHNQLTGRIPQGKMFNTCLSSSYEGNIGLCGFPVSEKCKEVKTPPFEERDESEFGDGFEWRSILTGYGFGFMVGVITGHIILSIRLYGLVQTLAIHILGSLFMRNEYAQTTCIADSCSSDGEQTREVIFIRPPT
ncbi:hypothetical protein CsatB_029627 [Cannabis sativa]